MGIMVIFKASSIKKENERLLSLINEMGVGDAIAVKARIEEYQNILKKLQDERESLVSTIASLKKEIESRKSQIIVLDDEILLESFALYKPKFSFQTSDEYKSRLDAC